MHGTWRVVTQTGKKKKCRAFTNCARCRCTCTKKAGKDGQAIAGHASETMTKNYQKDHADVIWSDAIPDLNISEITG